MDCRAGFKRPTINNLLRRNKVLDTKMHTTIESGNTSIRKVRTPFMENGRKF